MNGTITYTVNIDGNGNAVMQSIVESTAKVQKSMGKAQSLCDKFGASFLKLDAVKRAIEGVGVAFDNIMAPGMRFESSMADLSAITGITGSGLDEIGAAAKKSAEAFGGDAAKSVESYKVLLSKLGPEIAKTPAALDAMGNSVATLSKVMGGDTLAAADVLTTAMNQFQISLDDPIAASAKMSEMMNVMAAAAKEGSAELPQIKLALEQCGMAAKMAGVSFEETNAAIQILDKAGKKGAEGGIALRNAMSIMGEGRFMPKETQDALKMAGIDINALGDKSKSLTDRLGLLKPVMNDSALMSKIFGRENANAGIALISGIGQIDTYTKAITGTTTAQDQAKLVMETTTEKMSRMNATVDNLKIGMFGLVGASYPYLSIGTDMMSTIGQLYPAMQALGKVTMFLTSAEKMKAAWTTISNLFTKESIVVTTAKGIADKFSAASTWICGAAIAAYTVVIGVLNGTISLTTIATTIWTGAQWLLNVALTMNPVGLIILAIVALIAIIVYVAMVTDGWGATWSNLMKAMKIGFNLFLESFNLGWLVFKDLFLSGLEVIEKGWYRLKGLWDKEGANAGLSKLQDDRDARAKEISAAKGKIDDMVKELKVMKINEITFNDATPSDALKKVKKTMGIADPKTAGGGGGAGGSGAGKSSTEAIATGGARSTNINITFRNLVENISYKGGSGENKEEFVRDIAQQLFQVLNMAQSSVS